MLSMLLRKTITCHLSPFNSAFTSSPHLSPPLLSTAPSPSPSPPHSPSPPPSPSPPASDFVIQYLINSCGLSFDKAAKASRYLPNFKSPEKLDAVLRFLRDAGIPEPHIKAAVSRDPRILRASVEKCLKPKIVQLQQMGFSSSHISCLLSTSPAPASVGWKLEVMEFNVKRAEALGIPHSSGMFVYALMVVSWLKQSMIDARLHHLKSLGFSQEEATLLISKASILLQKSEKMLSRRVEFLINCAGCDKSQVVRNPVFLMYSLEKRLIPRNLVWEILKLKEVPVANRKFIAFAKLTEKQFLEKFVLPFEKDIPGIHQAYCDACSGKTPTNE